MDRVFPGILHVVSRRILGFIAEITREHSAEKKKREYISQ
jgi:hypothetical protein